MITEQQAEELVYERINRPSPAWPDKPEMVVIRVVERPLNWIVYWTSKTHWENPEADQAPIGNGPILVSRADGTLVETNPIPPIEHHILAVEQQIEAHLAARV